MLPGVYLLAESGPADRGVAENGRAESGGGEVAVPGLRLTFLETGIELVGADGETVWESGWSEVAEISPAGSSVLPDGGSALQLLAVERSGRRWSLVVPTEDAEATAASVRQRARSHGLRSRSGPPAVRRSLTVAVAVLVVAVVTLLLLSAVHVLSF